MRVGVATLQRGRHAHLANQAAGVAAQDCEVARYVVVSMDAEPPEVPGADVVHLPVDGPLPLAAARNRAVAELAGCDLAVLLDVDCVPAPDLVRAYATADLTALLAGPVHYWQEGDCPLSATARHSGDSPLSATARHVRDSPFCAFDKRGVPEVAPRPELFWSLSFAVAPEVHARIGGFDEGYLGYGAEDTDYGFAAAAAGVPLRWTEGWAFHQWHPVSSPPREHVAAIVPNALRFRAKWGRWPMEGWLAAFAAEGLVYWEPDGEALRLIDHI